MTEDNASRRWVTLARAAIELRSTKERVLRQVTLGRIRAVKQDREWRLDLGDVLALAAESAAPEDSGVAAPAAEAR